MEKVTEETEIAVMSTNIKHLVKEFDAFKEDIKDEIKSLKNSYVTKGEFEPIKNIVYGLVGTVLVSVIGAILSLILRK